MQGVGWSGEQGVLDKELLPHEAEGSGAEGQHSKACFYLGPLSWLWTWSQGTECVVLWFTFLSL